MSQPAPGPSISREELQRKTLQRFGQIPCKWQCTIAQEFLKGDRDVVLIAATGSGKTLTFWMPLLAAHDSVQIVCAPLNLLGTVNVASLAQKGIPAICITAENATDANFADIGRLKYRVVMTNVEVLMKPEGGMERLLKDPNFTRRLLGITFDEAHCISKWGGFRPEYRQIEQLRYTLPQHVRFFLVTATCPKVVRDDIFHLLRIRKESVFVMHRSNDRPNIRLTVRKMIHPANSFLDLAFLIPDPLPDDWRPPKVLIFFDNIAESVRAGKFLRRRLPINKRGLFRWFNSEMSAEYREDGCEDLKAGRAWGFVTTDSFGMGLDVPDVELVIQWKVTCDLNTMWQRFGRAGRNKTVNATAMLIAEKGYFDEDKGLKETRKRKAAAKLESSGPTKKICLAKSEPTPKLEVLTPMLEPPMPRLEVLAMPASVDVEEIERATSALYNRMPVESRGGKADSELEPVMDDFVNAKSRQSVGCHRKPAMIYFGNTKLASDEKACRPDLPSGCPRCGYTKPSVCCECCNPQAFMDFAPPDPNLRPKSAPPRSNLKKYERGELDHALESALDHYRFQTAERKYGHGALDMMGSGLVMSDEVLQRIVLCAHYRKIQSVEDLIRETRWIGAREYFNDIRELVEIHSPPPKNAPLTTRVPLDVRRQGGASGGSTAAQPKRRNPNRCGTCKELGHNANNRQKCRSHPDHPSRSLTISADKENLEPHAHQSRIPSVPTTSKIETSTSTLLAPALVPPHVFYA